MERPRWRRCCAFFAVSLVCLAGKLYTCGPVGAAAAGVADSSASLQSVDLAAGPLEGAEQNGQAQGALAGEGEQPNREAANFQEEPYEVQRDDPLFNENRSAAGARGTSASFVLKNMITFALTVAIVFLSARIIWDIMNFVGDVPDPFAHVQSSQDIPAAIEDLLEQGNPVAFVIRRCKYCGLGLRAMKNAGYSPVVVMVEGHRFQEAIRHHLRSVYKVRGLPYFFLNRDEHGYLAAIKGFLEDNQ